jgi:hypothetical protein
MSTRLMFRCLLSFVLPAISTVAWAVTPPGIVFESEAICEPQSAWQKDRGSPNHWMLWTKEDNIERKRSGGAVLASPSVTTDRQRPEEGAPPLHAVVRGLEPGLYAVYLSAPGRPLAYSLDGKEWIRYQGGELALGKHRIADRPFEFWIDDRYAAPANNRGPAYFDYVRFLPVPLMSSDVRREEAWKGLDYWLRSAGRGAAVPFESWEVDGFEREHRRRMVSTRKAGATCSCLFDRDGTFYPAVQMADSAGVFEQLSVCVDGKEVAHLVGEEETGQSGLFCIDRPIAVRRGQRLTLKSVKDGILCRIEEVYLASEPIRPPEAKIENVQVWSPNPGEAHVCWTTSRLVATGVVEYGTASLSNRTEASEYVGQNHQVILRGLDPQASYQARITTKHGQKPLVSDVVRFQAALPKSVQSKPQSIPLAIPEPTAKSRRDWPVTMGLPLARGMLADTSDLRLVDASGKPVDLDACPLSRWPDGSIAWAVLDFKANTDAGATAPTYTLKIQPDSTDRPSSVPTLQRLPDRCIMVVNGEKVVIGGESDAAFTLDRGNVQSPVSLELTTGDGMVWTCGRPDLPAVALEVTNSTRSVVKFSGPMVARDGTKAWSYLVRLTTWRGRPGIGLDVSLCNDQPSLRSRAVRSWVLRLPLDGGSVRGAVEGGALEAVQSGQEIRLLQEKDDHYTVQSPAGNREGKQAAGLAAAVGDTLKWTAVVPQFWESYPLGFAIKPKAFDVELLPRLSADSYSDRDSLKVFQRLYAWFQDGNYLFRAGQLLRRQLVLLPAALSGDEAASQLQWWSRPLVPQAPATYLCGTGVLGRTLAVPQPGVWDVYEKMFTDSFARHLVDRQQDRTFGWMHFGDWFGERDLNYGNNEYDMAWSLAIQWMRTGRREYFDRGQEMARHYSTVDTVHGDFARNMNGIVREHSFNHVGTDLTPEQLHMGMADRKVQAYLERYGRGMFHGAIDRQGHVFQEGNWLYASLTGDRFLWDVAQRVCDNQAEWLTKGFDFGIERAGGWPLINAVAAYRHTANPYYLNSARLMIQRCLERQDPVLGGWLHYPPIDETGDVPVYGGKAFAVGILSYGILRYLDVEPRPEVRRMLVRATDWLMKESWNPDRGFRYITKCQRYHNAGERGMTCLLNAELVAFAYEETRDKRYLDFWQEMTSGVFDKNFGAMGKGFAQCVHQTVFGLERIRPWVTAPVAK